MKKILLLFLFVFCGTIVPAQDITVFCADFTLNGKESRLSSNLKNVFEAELDANNLPFIIVQRDLDILREIDKEIKLQSLSNIQIVHKHEKELIKVGAQYIIFGDLNAPFSPADNENYFLNITFTNVHTKEKKIIGIWIPQNLVTSPEKCQDIIKQELEKNKSKFSIESNKLSPDDLSLPTNTIDTVKQIDSKEKQLNNKEKLDNYEKSILMSFQKKDFPAAIDFIAKYEETILNLYENKSFENGLYRSKLHNLSFQSLFQDWEEKTISETENSDMPKEFNVLLLLQNKLEEHENLLLCLFDQSGIGFLDNKDKVSVEDELLKSSKIGLPDFGIIEKEEMLQFGHNKALIQEFDTPIGKEPMIIARLLQNNKFFIFWMHSNRKNFTKNKKLLFDLINTIELSYSSPDTLLINKKTAHLDFKSPIEILKCTRSLIKINEYNAAKEILSKLKTIIADEIYKSVSANNRVSFPYHGITFINPSPEEFDMNCNGQLLTLLKKQSIIEEGIIIFINDLKLSYSKGLIESLKDEKALKDCLIGAGQGGGLSIGKIETQGFCKIKDFIAYEATIIPYIAGTRGKIWVFINYPKYMIGIIAIVNSFEFENRIVQYKEYIEGNWLSINKR